MSKDDDDWKKRMLALNISASTEVRTAWDTRMRAPITPRIFSRYRPIAHTTDYKNRSLEHYNRSKKPSPREERDRVSRTAPVIPGDRSKNTWKTPKDRDIARAAISRKGKGKGKGKRKRRTRMTRIQHTARTTGSVSEYIERRKKAIKDKKKK
jgi:hypothetical protein